MYKKWAAFFLAASLIAPLAASAQDEPSYAQPEPGVERIQGRVASFDGLYNLSVTDERGFTDRVHIHPGTIINPTGITLSAGMVVSIIGENDGEYFSGDEVDTPYSVYGGVPYYQSHPWDYYGSAFTLGFFFGNLGWWHGNYFSGYNYGWWHGYRYYSIPNYRVGIWYHPDRWSGYHAGPWSRGYYHGSGYGHPAVYQSSVNIYNRGAFNSNVYNRNTYNRGAYSASGYNHGSYNTNVYNRGNGYIGRSYNRGSAGQGYGTHSYGERSASSVRYSGGDHSGGNRGGGGHGGHDEHGR